VNNKLLKIAEPALIWILGILTNGIHAITKWIQQNPKTAQYVILFLGALSILAPILLVIGMVTQ
jgi:hypothetical protein